MTEENDKKSLINEKEQSLNETDIPAVAQNKNLASENDNKQTNDSKQMQVKFVKIFKLLNLFTQFIELFRSNDARTRRSDI